MHACVTLGHVWYVPSASPLCCLQEAPPIKPPRPGKQPVGQSEEPKVFYSELKVSGMATSARVTKTKGCRLDLGLWARVDWSASLGFFVADSSADTTILPSIPLAHSPTMVQVTNLMLYPDFEQNFEMFEPLRSMQVRRF